MKQSISPNSNTPDKKPLTPSPPPEQQTLEEQAHYRYTKPTEELLLQHPNATALRSHIEQLQKTRDKYHLHLRRLSKLNKAANKEKIQEITLNLFATDKALRLISQNLIARLEQLGIEGGAAYAYGPREGVHYEIHTPGRDHFQLSHPFIHGRLVRQMGDLICRPSREFWGLRVTNDPTFISCRACIRRILLILESQET
jgi:hypothetical protein